MPSGWSVVSAWNRTSSCTTGSGQHSHVSSSRLASNSVTQTRLSIAVTVEWSSVGGRACRVKSGRDDLSEAPSPGNLLYQSLSWLRIHSTRSATGTSITAAISYCTRTRILIWIP